MGGRRANPPGQTRAGPRGCRGLVVATGVAREEEGGSPPPPSEKGVKMFQLAQLNVFAPDVKKEGRGTGGASPCASRRWDWGVLSVLGGRPWTLTWSEIMGIGGFDLSAANRGAYAGLVHGIACRPKPKPKPKAPTTPATGDPQPHLANSGMPSPRPSGNFPRPR